MTDINPAFAWFGGKRRWTDEINRRIGAVQTYAEPFAGSLACLLSRPRARHEVVCDLDHGIVNFHRAAARDPEAVWKHADWPPNHVDLVARRRWLVRWAADAKRNLTDDPWWYDAQAAGWWLWAQNHSVRARQTQHDTVPQPTPSGVHTLEHAAPAALQRIQRRLARVLVLARPWSSAVTRQMLHPRGETVVGILMDPPYIGDRSAVYSADGADADGAAVESYEWSVTHGRKYRIAYCCTAGTFPAPAGWNALTRGFGAITNARRRAARQDMIMFSPLCTP